MLWGHSWLIDKIRNISWHVILQVCPRYKIVVVVGHNGVKSLPEVASKMSSNTKVVFLSTQGGGAKNGKIMSK